MALPARQVPDDLNPRTGLTPEYAKMLQLRELLGQCELEHYGALEDIGGEGPSQACEGGEEYSPSICSDPASSWRPGDSQLPLAQLLKPSNKPNPDKLAIREGVHLLGYDFVCDAVYRLAEYLIRCSAFMSACHLEPGWTLQVPTAAVLRACTAWRRVSPAGFTTQPLRALALRSIFDDRFKPFRTWLTRMARELAYGWATSPTPPPTTVPFAATFYIRAKGTTTFVSKREAVFLRHISDSALSTTGSYRGDMEFVKVRVQGQEVAVPDLYPHTIFKSRKPRLLALLARCMAYKPALRLLRNGNIAPPMLTTFERRHRVVDDETRRALVEQAQHNLSIPWKDPETILIDGEVLLDRVIDFLESELEQQNPVLFTIRLVGLLTVGSAPPGIFAHAKGSTFNLDLITDIIATWRRAWAAKQTPGAHPLLLSIVLASAMDSQFPEMWLIGGHLLSSTLYRATRDEYTRTNTPTPVRLVDLALQLDVSIGGAVASLVASCHEKVRYENQDTPSGLASRVRWIAEGVNGMPDASTRERLPEPPNRTTIFSESNGTLTRLSVSTRTSRRHLDELKQFSRYEYISPCYEKFLDVTHTPLTECIFWTEALFQSFAKKADRGRNDRSHAEQ